ncbi:uncharacterized protein BCR38DRAFT_150925 [Pseudomassariella vexata]|uniref:Uncharacterized protein n=1 Tax=Pseudomassariella vexata TaxID=1141098 RepID=A0A1Y2E680_9PEZI|nr:uncharacterized protein BCR38DRAFT_150925 [Pseudomassariella vexata]ORY67073.1 hypothetical protein BCR38DRAFT_150925 [Pseudomassariella vexata]
MQSAGGQGGHNLVAEAARRVKSFLVSFHDYIVSIAIERAALYLGAIFCHSSRCNSCYPRKSAYHHRGAREGWQVGLVLMRACLLRKAYMWHRCDRSDSQSREKELKSQPWCWVATIDLIVRNICLSKHQVGSRPSRYWTFCIGRQLESPFIINIPGSISPVPRPPHMRPPRSLGIVHSGEAGRLVCISGRPNGQLQGQKGSTGQ